MTWTRTDEWHNFQKPAGDAKADSYSEPEFRQHLLGGVRTAAGAVGADCAPPTYTPGKRLAYGTHQVRVHATDAARDVGAARWTFTVTRSDAPNPGGTMCTRYDAGTPADMRELISRRGFLKAGATVAVAGAVSLAGSPAVANDPASDTARPRPFRHRVPPETISIQLYTMRELMDADLDAVFAGLAAIGYRQVEHAGFHGRTAREFKAALDRHGLRATSGHQSPYPYEESRWRTMIEDAYLLGQRYMVEPLPAFIATGLVSPLSPPSLTWAQYAQDLNKAAEQASIFGIEVGYHNHNAEFVPLPDDPDRTGYDILLAETDPDLVHFELDIYWALRAGKDPVELLRAHPTRFRQFHVKDMGADGAITAPGTGVIDFVPVFQAAVELGITQYIIEQDNAGQDAMESARLGFELLSTIRW